MLRITSIKKAPAEIILLVEGRLVGPWVAELETAVIGAGVVSGSVSIDLSSVSFVDPRGLKLLHRLLARGVVLQAVSPFVQELYTPIRRGTAGYLSVRCRRGEH